MHIALLYCCASLLVTLLPYIVDAYSYPLVQSPAVLRCDRNGGALGCRDHHDVRASPSLHHSVCGPSSSSFHKRFRCSFSLYSALDDDDDQETNSEGFTQKQLLKEETEAPFRTVRIYLYIALLSAAGLGSLIGLTKFLAISSSGRSEYEDMNELYTNLAVNLGGLPVLGWLWKRGSSFSHHQRPCDSDLSSTDHHCPYPRHRSGQQKKHP